MKFSIAMPLGNIAPGEFQTPEAVREISRALEAAGVDAGYLTDHPAPSAAWLHGGGMGHDALDPPHRSRRELIPRAPHPQFVAPRAKSLQPRHFPSMARARCRTTTRLPSGAT